MRTTSALVLLLLAGCATARPEPVIRRMAMNYEVIGITQPIVFRLDSAIIVGSLNEAPCETRDRMPNARPRREDLPPMPRARTPEPLPFIPNACAVKVAAGAAAVPKTVPGAVQPVEVGKPGQ